MRKPDRTKLPAVAALLGDLLRLVAAAERLKTAATELDSATGNVSRLAVWATVLAARSLSAIALMATMTLEPRPQKHADVQAGGATGRNRSPGTDLQANCATVFVHWHMTGTFGGASFQ
jgi:hypothetical protein